MSHCCFLLLVVYYTTLYYSILLTSPGAAGANIFSISDVTNPSPVKYSPSLRQKQTMTLQLVNESKATDIRYYILNCDK